MVISVVARGNKNSMYKLTKKTHAYHQQQKDPLLKDKKRKTKKEEEKRDNEKEKKRDSD